MSDALATSIATLAAAIIGAILAFLSSSHTEKNHIKQEKINILYSIRAELIALSALINNRKSEILPVYVENNPENYREYNFLYLPASYNYFTTYDSLSPKLGMIENKQLITEIICGYCDIKGLWENLRDLEYVAKKGLEYSLNASGSEKHLQTIAIHSNYVAFILKNQLPIIEKVILDCLVHIDQEINSYED